MKDQVRIAVLRSFELVIGDGHLLDCPIEENCPYDARKLHGVCINHRLAHREVIPVSSGRQSRVQQRQPPQVAPVPGPR